MKKVKILELPKAQDGIPPTDIYTLNPVEIKADSLDKQGLKIKNEVLANPELKSLYEAILADPNYSIKLINYPYGYKDMLPGHMESVLNYKSPTTGEEYSISGMYPARTRINPWPEGNNKVYYNDLNNPTVRSVNIRPNQGQLAKWLYAANLKKDYNFIKNNCADQNCEGLGINPESLKSFGITDPALVMDYVLANSDFQKSDIRGNRVDMAEGVRDIVDYGIEEGSKAAKNYYNNTKKYFGDAIDNTWNYFFKKEGGSLPKADKGGPGDPKKKKSYFTYKPSLGLNLNNTNPYANAFSKYKSKPFTTNSTNVAESTSGPTSQLKAQGEYLKNIINEAGGLDAYSKQVAAQRAYEALPNALRNPDTLTADKRGEAEKFARRAWTAVSHPMESMAAVNRGGYIPSGYLGMHNPYGDPNPMGAVVDMALGMPAFIANAFTRQSEKFADNPGEYLLTNTLGFFDPKTRDETLGNYLDLAAFVPAAKAASPLLKSAGTFLTTQTPLRYARAPQVYKYLPEGTFSGYSKLRTPEKSYRVAGMDAFDDFAETGILRSYTPMPKPGMSFAEKLTQRPTAFPSFQKGYADLSYLPEEGGVVFETGLPTFKRGEINPVTGKPIKGRHYAHRVLDPETGATLSSVPGTDIRVFEGKPNWLRGHKEMDTGLTSLYRVEPKGRTFPSFSNPHDERYIDWSMDFSELYNDPGVASMILSEPEVWKTAIMDGERVIAQYYPQSIEGNWWSSDHPDIDFQMFPGQDMHGPLQMLEVKVPKKILPQYQSLAVTETYGNPRSNEFILPSMWRDRAKVTDYIYPKKANGGDISIPDLRRVKIKSLPKAQNGDESTSDSEFDYNSAAIKLNQEKRRIANMRNQIIPIAISHDATSDNRPFKVRLPEGQPYCTTRACEAEREAGFPINQVASGYKLMKEATPENGWYPTSYDQLLPGDIAQVVRNSGFGHTMISTGDASNMPEAWRGNAAPNQKGFYWDNGSGSDFQFASPKSEDQLARWMNNVKRMNYYTYKGNLPQYEKEYEQAFQNWLHDTSEGDNGPMEPIDYIPYKKQGGELKRVKVNSLPKNWKTK
jgi:hypothetical protein